MGSTGLDVIRLRSDQFALVYGISMWFSGKWLFKQTELGGGGRTAMQQ